MNSKHFSLIELMTVVIVILILITLSIPKFNEIRMKSKTVICSNQLKQMGTLLASYANDHKGFLPYTRNKPYYSSGSYSYRDKRTGKLYGSWAGHLIPYVNIKLTSWSRGNYYHDKARVKGSYSVTFHAKNGDLEKDKDVLKNENFGNWKLLHDMFYEGGHGSLKLFICPESTDTFYTQYLKSGREVSRISGIVPTRWDALNGLPSSYLSNGQLFGAHRNQSQRYEDINKKNYLLLEGCDNVNMATPYDYQKFFELSTVYGGAVNNVIRGWGPSAQNPASSPSSMSASFMHDDTTEVWYSWRGYMPISSINKYNKIFYPNAAASYMWDRPEGKSGVLTANRYPGEKWQNFEAPFTKNKFKIYRYYSEGHQPNYMFGEMNILLADLSVKKSHLGWLFENGRELGTNTQ